MGVTICHAMNMSCDEQEHEMANEFEVCHLFRRLKIGQLSGLLAKCLLRCVMGYYITVANEY